jgi:broad specificity phosphatase PhoE
VLSQGGGRRPSPRSLVVIRHGRTEANARGVLLGRQDPSLDEVGWAQAEALAVAVSDGRFGEVGAVVSSPLVRTHQTAQLAAERLGLEVELDERLIELDYGEFDGTPVSEIPGPTWHRWRSDMEFRPPGGESLAELHERVRSACAEWATRVPDVGGTVVMVSHVSPIKAAVAWALGVESVAWRAHLDTASITVITLRGDAPVLASFNETAHLR